MVARRCRTVKRRRRLAALSFGPPVLRSSPCSPDGFRYIDLFLDSSALFAGVASSTGAARALLLLAEADPITITVSEQVVAETERALARKLPRALRYYREALRSTGLRIVRDPSPEEVHAHQEIIAHPADVPIVVAAMKAGAGFLATFNRRHFIDDPQVAVRAGVPIGTPEEALAWVRVQLAPNGR